MLHIGLYCPAEAGHLNPTLSIGRGLKNRGHKVTFIGVADTETKVTQAGLEFCLVGESIFPKGSTIKIFEKLGEMDGLKALIFTVQIFEQLANILLQEDIEKFRNLNLDGFVIDQTTAECAAIAQRLDLPYITICNALLFNAESSTPPLYTTWSYAETWWAKLRNYLVHNSATAIMARFIQSPIKKYLKEHGLPPKDSFDSPLAILCQEPKSLEFPRSAAPPQLHFTGPFHMVSERVEGAFPWEKLTGKPLIYASMGTLQNRLSNIFEMIAEACQDLDAQLVISLGGSGDPNALPTFPGNPLVVNYAPQLKLLAQASLTITHAGMNTALESITYGVPMVAIPITNDQPGVAARIKYSGAGEFITLNQLSTAKLKEKVTQVLTNKRYQESADLLKQEIQDAYEKGNAIKIIEQALSSRKVILANLL